MSAIDRPSVGRASGFFRKALEVLEAYCTYMGQRILAWMAFLFFILGLYATREVENRLLWIAVLTLLYCQVAALLDLRGRPYRDREHSPSANRPSGTGARTVDR